MRVWGMEKMEGVARIKSGRLEWLGRKGKKIRRAMEPTSF